MSTPKPEIRRATHGFNVYIGLAMVQIHVNDGDEAEGEKLANLIAAAPAMFLKLVEYAAAIPDEEALAIIAQVEGRL